MLQLDTRHTGPEPANDTLELDFAARSKTRQRVRLGSGEEAALMLERGTLLRGGEKLKGSDGRMVAVIAAPEDVLEARCEGPLALARAAYHLGNRHVSVEIGDGWLRIQADHVLEHMLRGLGCRVHALRAPFEPESGAYSSAGHRHTHGHDHGHSHSHGEESGAKIHMMAG